MSAKLTQKTVLPETKSQLRSPGFFMSTIAIKNSLLNPQEPNESVIT